jgi:hypothetical protein
MSRHQEAGNALEHQSLDVLSDILHPCFDSISSLPLPIKLLMLPGRLHPLMCALHLKCAPSMAPDGTLGSALNVSRSALLVAATAALPQVAGLDWLEFS